MIDYIKEMDKNIAYIKEYIKKFPQHKKDYEKPLRLLQSSKDMLILKERKIV